MANDEKRDDVDAGLARTLVDLATEFGQHQLIRVCHDDEQGADLLTVFVPEGLNPYPLNPLLDQLRDAPRRAKGTADTTSLDSFIALVNRHRAAGNTVVFCDDANRGAPSLIAVLNYHGAGDPQFGDHRVRYPFPLSEEWIAWNGAAGNYIPQAEFADYLESRIVDVVDPVNASAEVKSPLSAITQQGDLATAVRLLSIARDLSLRVDARLQSAVKLSSGESSITWEEEHTATDGGPLRVPVGFVIGIPVFRNGPRYEVAVRLRYRVAGGKVSWGVFPLRPDLAFDDAVAEACAAVEEKTTCPVYHGTPEVAEPIWTPRG